MSKKTVKKFFSKNIREVALVIMILVIAIAVQIRTGGIFLTAGNLYDLFREASILIMVSMGMMMVILTGNIDLSLGSIMGLSGMLVALTLKNHNDIPLIFLFVLAIVVGAVCGLINGFIVAKLHVYALIATLATKYIFRGVVYLFSGGAWVAQADMTPEFIAITTTNFMGINSLIWFAIVVSIFSYILLHKTETGRRFYAVGNNKEAAAVTGIKVRASQILAYVFCGIICGVAGLLWICKYGNAQSESCDGYEISIIAAVVVGGCNISGGTGTVVGVILGAILMGTLNNILPLIQVSTYWQQAIKGAVILASIIFNAIMQKRVKQNELKRRVI